jgi:hypothetical protein
MLFFSNTIIAQKELNDNFVIGYLGFFSHYLDSSFNVLKFEITNKSQDTLYISERNILTIISKGGVILKEKICLPIGAPIILSLNDRKQFKCEEKDNYEKGIEKLKLNFANKLYDKNFGSNSEYKSSKDFILKNIIRDCIVLLPNESINYSKGFDNEAFDKTCKVKIRYINTKIFSSFVNDDDKIVEINN